MTAAEAALAASRAVLLLAEAVAFGTLVVRALAEPGSARAGLARLARLGWIGLAVLGPVWIVLQSMAIAGTSAPGRILADTALVLGAARVGHAALLRAAFWLAAALLARARPRLAVLPGGCAMALHAASGHAAAAGEPWLLAAVLAHVLAASAWIGGLPALIVGLRGAEPDRLVRRFATLGLACVLVLAVTAAWQAHALAGGLGGWFGTEYGRLLQLKLGLFAALILLALRHRFVLAHRPAALRRSVAIEAALGLATLGVASLLSAVPPGAHEQPDWPFAWRPSLTALADPDLRQEVAGAVLGLAGAAALVLLATWLRRLRWPALAASAALVWLAVPHLDLLVVPAEPTVFWQAPADATPASIALGAAAYAAHCASCHGAGGRGDGRLASGLAIPPADLTAAHLWDHADGTLFWWISAGMAGPDGHLVMPGFAGRTDAATRWALIDFLHANNPYAPGSSGMRHHH